MQIGFKTLVAVGMVTAIAFASLMGVSASNAIGQKRERSDKALDVLCWNLRVIAPLSRSNIREMGVLSANYEHRQELTAEIQSLARAGTLSVEQRHGLCQRLAQSRQGPSTSSSGSTPLAMAISR